ncbi:MAG: PRC-barrel domain-containing protein [Hyphomicrobiaceae bacterium]|nr:PRC-barrel domain-containing protein [Hyphomicrobiaceae bacterium]
MRHMLSAVVLATVLGAGSAFAQTTTTTPAPSTGLSKGAADTSSATTMTDEQARAWVGKTVYGADAKNVGEVAAIVRDTSGKITELHADVGGFLGLGETRVRVMPNEFKIVNDRIVLNVSSDQVKALPQIAQ